MFNSTFKALLNEAQFTNEMLGAGVTQLAYANYADRGRYFQAFTSLCTGFERIGKLCVMLDHYLIYNGEFPDKKSMQVKYRHDLALLYKKSQEIKTTRKLRFRHLEELKDPIHVCILSILTNFAKGDRYANIDLLGGMASSREPISRWYAEVDQAILETRVSTRIRGDIETRAKVISELISPSTMTRHIAETGDPISDVEDASRRAGMNSAVVPYRQLYVLQMIRYWVELLSELHALTCSISQEDVPFLPEIFRMFNNEDRYFKSRRTWAKP
jgi:hypothetical protein